MDKILELLRTTAKAYFDSGKTSDQAYDLMADRLKKAEPLPKGFYKELFSLWDEKELIQPTGNLKTWTPEQEAPNSDDHDDEPEDDQLRPADRQDMIQEYLDNYPDKVFRREDIQEEFGLSESQTQRDLRALKKAGRIGYREANALETNPKNPRETQWRRDAVYFSIKDRPPETVLPVTLKTMDDVRAFIDKWKHLATQVPLR